MIRPLSRLGLGMCCSVLVLCAAAAAAGDVYAPTVTVSITLPNGKVQTVDVRESETAVMRLDNGAQYKFRPTIVDARPWTQAVVTIFKAATAKPRR